jgi:hypothetical protein
MLFHVVTHHFLALTSLELNELMFNYFIYLFCRLILSVTGCGNKISRSMSSRLLVNVLQRRRLFSVAAVVSSVTVAAAGLVIGQTNKNRHLLLKTSHCSAIMSEDDNIPGLYSQDRLRSMSINISGI